MIQGVRLTTSLTVKGPGLGGGKPRLATPKLGINWRRGYGYGRGHGPGTRPAKLGYPEGTRH